MNKDMLARMTSRVFHPLIFSVLLPFTVIYKSTDNVLYAFKWMAFSSGFIVLTMVTFFLFRPKEFFKDFDISHKEKRNLLYILGGISTFIYFITLVALKGILFPLSIVSLGVIMSCVILEIVNRYLKVSIHVAMASAYIVTIGILYGLPILAVTFWIIPAVAWARLRLKKHTLPEVITGFLLGELVTSLTFVAGMWLH